MRTELPNADWQSAVAIMERANRQLEEADAMEDIRRAGAEAHAATMGLIATPAPDVRALVVKLEAARLDADEIMDGTLDLIIADARRLAGIAA